MTKLFALRRTFAGISGGTRCFTLSPKLPPRSTDLWFCQSFGRLAALQAFAGGLVLRAGLVETLGGVGRAVGDELLQHPPIIGPALDVEQALVGQRLGEADHQALAMAHGFRRASLGLAAPRHVGALAATPELHLAEALGELVRAATDKGDVRCFGSPAAAFAAAQKEVTEGDRIVVFGSFLTVADVLAAIKAARH